MLCYCRHLALQVGVYGVSFGMLLLLVIARVKKVYIWIHIHLTGQRVSFINDSLTVKVIKRLLVRGPAGDVEEPGGDDRPLLQSPPRQTAQVAFLFRVECPNFGHPGQTPSFI